MTQCVEGFVTLGAAALGVINNLVERSEMGAEAYSWWRDCLVALAAGEAPLPCPERDRPMCGRYCWFRRDGTIVAVAIDPLADGSGFQVQVGQKTPFPLTAAAKMEDFCEHEFGWFAENPVSSAEYAEWWATGRFPPEVEERRKARTRRIRERTDAQRRPRNPSASRTA
jgi:hypothetical protein